MLYPNPEDGSYPEPWPSNPRCVRMFQTAEPERCISEPVYAEPSPRRRDRYTDDNEDWQEQSDGASGGFFKYLLILIAGLVAVGYICHTRSEKVEVRLEKFSETSNLVLLRQLSMRQREARRLNEMHAKKLERNHELLKNNQQVQANILGVHFSHTYGCPKDEIEMAFKLAMQLHLAEQKMEADRDQRRQELEKGLQDYLRESEKRSNEIALHAMQHVADMTNQQTAANTRLIINGQDNDLAQAKVNANVMMRGLDGLARDNQEVQDMGQRIAGQIKAEEAKRKKLEENK